MNIIKTTHKTRSFLKASALSGGGLMLGFNWQAAARAVGTDELPEHYYDMNACLKISRDGIVTITSPNTEVINTIMPVTVAEELDVAREQVVVEQLDRAKENVAWQSSVGSQIARHRSESLRMAGATARRMLLQAAANRWNIPVSELETNSGTIRHPKTGRSIRYGDVASDASQLQVPEEVTLKA